MDTFSKPHIPFILIIITLIVYLSTVCPTVYLGDSGELTAAAFSLGIPHPSGYPLYALIGKLFCLIPIGNIGFRMNLMSVIFSLATVWIVYSIIYKLTSSMVSSIFGAFTLAFTPLFWMQTVSAEVYPLHTFFVALLIRLLIYWDDKKDLSRLALFSFIVGLSFLNHLQTVMLAPAVLFFLVASDRKGVLNLRTLTTISILFLLALTVYVYLPIRTSAGAAIHWGDPDNLKNFLHVVTGENHRSGYVFNKTMMDYIIRSKDALILVIQQFGVILLFALWGLIKLPSMRWKIFYLGILFFDFFYTIFLNTVYIEVTPFNLPTLIAIAIMAGVGVADLLIRFKGFADKRNPILSWASNIACCAVPVILLVSSYNISDQSRNYNGYEHALNAFRTVNHGGILFVGGDNNIFPITFARIIERMREDVTIYDRNNLFFIMPGLDGSGGKFSYNGDWDHLITRLQEEIIEKKTEQGVYFLVFNPYEIPVPENHRLIPHGILSCVVNDQINIDQNKQISIWKYYATESLEDAFFRDYMNREITAYYNYLKGRHLVMLGAIEPGLRRLKLASEIGCNDEIIHTELSLFYSDFGLFNDAERELEKSLMYCQDYALVYNNWGYYYSKRGETDKAIESVRKAVEIDPDNTIYYNNLGNLLLEAGQKQEAVEMFRKSLSINTNQTDIKKRLEEIDVDTGQAGE